MNKNVLRSAQGLPVPLPPASAGFISKPEHVVPLKQLMQAKKGNEKAVLEIISKIRACLGIYKNITQTKQYVEKFASTQWYMEHDDINQIIDLKIIEAIHAWKSGGCNFPTLAKKYISRAFDVQYAGSNYYEGQVSNIFKTQHVQEQVQPNGHCTLNMEKIRLALANDRMYFALRLSMGLEGTEKMSFNRITDIIYGYSGRKVSRQAIHSLVKRAKVRLKKSFINEKELILNEKKTEP